MENQVLAEIMRTPWAILPERLDAAVAEFLRRSGASEAVEDDEGDEAALPRGIERQTGSVAVLKIHGVMRPRSSGSLFELLFGGGSANMERLTELVRRVGTDSTIKALVLDIDSPGGYVHGCAELADAVWETRQSKPVVAIANSLMASAAYWVGSQATEVWAAPGADVGSIGVYQLHIDWSEMYAAAGVKPTYIFAGKYKTEGNPYEPLSEEAQRHLQEGVDASYDLFAAAVARGRGVTPAKVRGGFGQGRVLDAKSAVSEGLVDHVGTLRDVYAKLGAGSGAAASAGRGDVDRRERKARLARMRAGAIK